MFLGTSWGFWWPGSDFIAFSRQSFPKNKNPSFQGSGCPTAFILNMHPKYDNIYFWALAVDSDFTVPHLFMWGSIYKQPIILEPWLARPRFHWFSIKFVLKTYHSGALAGQASIFIDFSYISLYLRPTVLEPWLARPRFSLIFIWVLLKEQF